MIYFGKGCGHLIGKWEKDDPEKDYVAAYNSVMEGA